MSREDLIPAGEVLKVHGLEGGLVLRFHEPFCPLKEIPAFVFLEIDGLPVPFPVGEAEAFGDCSYIFFFEDVTTRDRAMRYRDAGVFLEKKYLCRETEEKTLSLTGYRFLDETSGKRGEITGYMDIPENPLFEIRSGEEDLLIPAAEVFLRQVDHARKEVVFALPEGIFDADIL